MKIETCKSGFYDNAKDIYYCQSAEKIREITLKSGAVKLNLNGYRLDTFKRCNKCRFYEVKP